MKEMTKEMTNKKLRDCRDRLKLANYNMRLGNYESVVSNLKKSGQYIMSAESCLYFTERQVIEKLKN